MGDGERDATSSLGGDPGPMHVADGVDRPLVVLSSRTDVEPQWRRRRSPVGALRRPAPCSPCYRCTCPYDPACLDIAPDEAVDHRFALLSESTVGTAIDPPGGICVGSGS